MNRVLSDDPNEIVPGMMESIEEIINGMFDDWMYTGDFDRFVEGARLLQAGASILYDLVQQCSHQKVHA